MEISIYKEHYMENVYKYFYVVIQMDMLCTYYWFFMPIIHDDN